MSKTMKVAVAVGVVLAALCGSCLLCLVAGALSPSPSGPPARLQGRHACQVMSIIVAGGTATVQWQVAAMPPFTIEGDRYTTADGSGSVTVTDGVASFEGGPYDAWRGRTGSDTSGAFILFDGKEHHRVRTDGARRGDFKCYRQRD
jgi:hypothetical protein